MHDEFLHRLRKEPRPEFAARLRAHLRRQPASAPRSSVPSRARTLLSLLLLGGTAFAVTSVVMRGLPRPVIELYQLTIARMGAAHTATSTHPVGAEGLLAGLRWGASGASPPNGAALRTGSAHSAGAAMSARGSAASAGTASSGAAPAGGAISGPQGLELKLVTSWAAYPDAAANADHFNEVRGEAAKFGAPYIDVSVGNSAVWRDWPQAICSGKASGPDMAYTYEPVGTVNASPCPPHRFGPPSSIIAIPVGYEAVALARSPLYGALNLTRREVFLALAKWVPDPARPGTVHENGSTAWRQIDAALGPEPIQLVGPPLSSATGRSMIELLMEGGCNTYSWIAALKSTAPDEYARICRTVRADGVYSEVSSNFQVGLLAQPNAVGIIGFGDLMNATDGHLSVSRLDGVNPTPQDIESGAYPASRGIYLYVDRFRTPRSVALSFLQNEMWRFPYGVLVALPEPQRRAAFSETIY